MDKINFTVNGERQQLSGSDVSPSTTLNEYLRNYLGLLGTKAMCYEGGCGVCNVSVALTHSNTKEKQVISVNSCLVHVLSCHDWDITTVEGVGNRKDGYSELQTRLAEFNGTQCGYCTPGWIMNMHSIYENSQKNLSMRQIERSFGGNMCRCTGYRPILDAFKSFAIDMDTALANKLQDLEDLHKMKCLRKRKESKSEDWCLIGNDTRTELLSCQLGASRWYKCYNIKDIFTVLSREGTDSYYLVAGNTGKGVYLRNNEARVQIDISSISTLKDCYTDANLILGAGLSITEVIAIFETYSRTNSNFKYLEEFNKHLELVATVPVRNIGTIGGNLALKSSHHDFPSDLFLLFETVQATVTIVDSNLKNKEVKLPELLKIDLKNKLIVDVRLPPLSNNHHIKTYKIMPRSQNAHAIVNAGFHFFLDNESKVISADIVYGGIAPKFIHATNTEQMLKGRKLFTDDTLQKALGKLQEEINPVDSSPEPAPFSRKAIALGLFYKAILSLSPTSNARYKSGGVELTRDISHGTQIYDTDKSLWPLNQPIPKLEALTQCSGEALYACDINPGPRHVHLALVLSTVCLGEIVSFNAAEALKIPGVISFLTAKDIPGTNNSYPSDVLWHYEHQEIFASKKISYYGQPVGVIAATSRRLALTAADLVHVQYKKSSATPVLSIEEALKSSDKDKRIREDVNIKAAERGTDVTHTIKGTFYMPDQYHYTMETQCCTVAHTSRGLRVRSATQWMDIVHIAVANTLKLPLNRVEVEVPRIGGGYGGKASSSSAIACACALAAYKLGRNATLALPLQTNMAAIGKRQPVYTTFEVGVNNEGIIQYVDLEYYSDCGYSYNDTAAPNTASVLLNLYKSSRWSVRGYSVLTDKASNVWCRAPGTTEATAIIEHIMERIAFTVKKDPINVRIANIAPEHNILNDIIATLKTESNYEERKAEIDKYNSENAWIKKVLKMSIMSFPIEYYGNFAVIISVYHSDGTITISHGGIEMGQGINTKVAQVCAYTLKVPLDMVTVKGSNSFVSPNSMASSGSISSESIAFATVKACNELLERLKPAKDEMSEPTWVEVVKKSYEKGINLQVSAMMSQLDSLRGYNVYGACVCEVWLDTLSARTQIQRVDLIHDSGRSLSPSIDVGQIEGAFIMGLGLWTSERLVYDKSGRLLTDRSWTYKPPAATDIPVDFRVSFQRNSLNNNGVLRSKATGEPALVLAVGVYHAIHDAVVLARAEMGYEDTEWLKLDAPCCVENILKALSPKIESYKLQN